MLPQLILVLFIAFNATAGGQELPLKAGPVPQTNETATALQRLDLIIMHLRAIERRVERYELGQLLVLKRQVKAVQDSIREVNLGNLQTIQEIDTLAFLVESKAYLNSVGTPSTEKDINEMLTLIDAMANIAGVKKVTFSRTLSIFKPLKEILFELTEFQIPQDLRTALRLVLSEVAAVLAEENGDVAASEPAKKAVRSIRKLYPLFFELAANEKAFDYAVTIQGYAEKYADFARMEKLGSEY